MPRERDRRSDRERPVGESSGGEVSLSVEETNKLRASLGLKPLQEKKEEAAPLETSKESEKEEAVTQSLREKVKVARERRKEAEFFEKTKTLGEAGSESDDDVEAWIEKTRATKPEQGSLQKEEEMTAGGAFESGWDVWRMLDVEVMSEESDEEGRIAPELVGAKVKHKPDDIETGEAMILTLADQSILTEAGELNTQEDVLENALKAEEARRKKAYAASKPKKDEQFDEFGDKKSLLSKYDEEEEEAMTLDSGGAFVPDSMKPGTSIQQETLHTSLRPISDYISTDSAAAAVHDGDAETKHRQKRKRQKLRKKKETGMLDIVGELEATKEETMDWEADHGSRVDRRARMEQEEQERIEAKEQRTKKFDHALEKANLQTLKLKMLEDNDEEEEDELFNALNQAQLSASQQTQSRFDHLATGAQNRQKKEETQTDDKKLVLTDTIEFCRLFSGDNADVKKQQQQPAEDSDMDADVVQSPAAQKQERRRHIRSKTSEGQEDTIQQEVKEEPSAAPGALREPILGSGLVTALNTLRDKGDLRQKFEWVGRTNDMKKSRLVGVDDFYTCGEGKDRLEKSIETALTRKDHLGRVLTPKEAFREISYAFHGKGPSQRTIEKRKRKMNDDFLAKKSNLDQESQLTRLKAVQKVQKNPFVVLSGGETPGKETKGKKKKTVKKTSTEPTSKEGFPALTPILDRDDSNAPLEGNKKVEAMLGIHPRE